MPSWRGRRRRPSSSRRARSSPRRRRRPSRWRPLPRRSRRIRRRSGPTRRRSIPPSSRPSAKRRRAQKRREQVEEARREALEARQEALREAKAKAAREAKAKQAQARAGAESRSSASSSRENAAGRRRPAAAERLRQWTGAISSPILAAKSGRGGRHGRRHGDGALHRPALGPGDERRPGEEQRRRPDRQRGARCRARQFAGGAPRGDAIEPLGDDPAELSRAMNAAPRPHRAGGSGAAAAPGFPRADDRAGKVPVPCPRTGPGIRHGDGRRATRIPVPHVATGSRRVGGDETNRPPPCPWDAPDLPIPTHRPARFTRGPHMSPRGRVGTKGIR